MTSLDTHSHLYLCLVLDRRSPLGTPGLKLLQDCSICPYSTGIVDILDADEWSNPLTKTLNCSVAITKYKCPSRTDGKNMLDSWWYSLVGQCYLYLRLLGTEGLVNSHFILVLKSTDERHSVHICLPPSTMIALIYITYAFPYALNPKY